MATHGQAFKKFFQFGRETAGNWGVAATVDHRFPILSFTRGAKRDVIRSESMDGTRYRQFAYVAAKVLRPIVEMELTYTGLLLLLDGLLGTNTFGSNGGSTTGPVGGIYTHTLKMKDLFNSFTLEFGMGGIEVERYLGAKLNRATISGASHERLKVRLEFVAKDIVTGISATGALTSPTMDCILFDALSSFNDGTGTTGDVLSFELILDNNLSVRNFASELIDEPLSAGLADASFRIVEEFQSAAAINAHLALTQGAPALTFTQAGGSNKTFAISMPKAYLMEGCEPEGADRMTQTLLWAPIGDDGSPESYLSLVMQNTQATINT